VPQFQLFRLKFGSVLELAAHRADLKLASAIESRRATDLDFSILARWPVLIKHLRTDSEFKCHMCILLRDRKTAASEKNRMGCIQR
jgi:hypothetical protein